MPPPATTGSSRQLTSPSPPTATEGRVRSVFHTTRRTSPTAPWSTSSLTRRQGDAPITASRLGRSVLIEPTADLPLELARDRDAATTTVSFTPATCDPHVLSETKKPYVFPLSVTVGDDDPVAVDLPLDQPARDALAAMVQRVCTPPA